MRVINVNFELNENELITIKAKNGEFKYSPLCTKPTRRISVEEVYEIISRVFENNRFLKKSRESKNVTPKHFFWFTCMYLRDNNMLDRNITLLKLKVYKGIKYNNATVIHGIRKIKYLINNNKYFKSDWERILIEINKLMCDVYL
ncbi:MAG: hypothetical protein LDL10_00965 [Calditerrivibrio sp.]|nr:hypothetical protein [Calditerrivibrio sp.]